MKTPGWCIDLLEERAKDLNRKEKILQCVRQMVDEQETKTGIDSGTIAEALGLE